MLDIFLALLLALLLDLLFGEPKFWHPLVGYGVTVQRLEKQLNNKTRIYGILCWILAVLPLSVIGLALENCVEPYGLLNTIISGVILYLAIGWNSLRQHAKAVYEPLSKNNLAQARFSVSMIVSRDTEQMDENAITNATIESVLENGSDAIFSAIFWFVIAGIPGVILYRLSNTLDAMWGYKTERFLQFGWCAARMDDVLNLIPARLTALTYALLGNTSIALRCWRKQAFTWKSPNAGPVLAAGAGALNVSLGGLAQYHGHVQHRPHLGPTTNNSQKTANTTIIAACRLIDHSLLLWVLVMGFSVLVWRL